jgi:hypothetical protein
MLSFHGVLIEEFFDFHFPLTDPVRFIPMQLSVAFVTVRQADAANSLQLSPPSFSVVFPQLWKVVNSPADAIISIFSILPISSNFI